MQPVTRQFKKVSSAANYRKWNFWKEGDYLVGKYIRSEQKKFGKDMKTQYVIEVEETNFNSNGFIDPKGKAKDCGNLSKGTLIALNDNTTLSKSLNVAGVKEGDIVKITYEGSYLIKTGDFAGSVGKNVTLEVAEQADVTAGPEMTNHPSLDI